MERDKTLLLVESPAKAKTIQKYLGSQYIVRASVGHIKDLVTSDLGVDLETLRPRYRFVPEKRQLLQTLIDASKFAKEILIASDPDREGEAIAFHLQEVLSSSGLPVKRIKFHEITKKEILRVLESPEDLNQDLYDAQQARRSLDRLVGFLASPFLNRAIQEKSNLSAGRVQSIVLRILAEREKEIQDFQAEEYWNLEGYFSLAPSSKPDFSAKLIEKQKITSQNQADEIEQQILSSNSFIISKIKEEKKKRYPEPPFATATLCAAASSNLKFSTEKTMKTAQTLYESGLISYMRTDSVSLSSEAISSIRNWLKENNHTFPASPPIYHSKNSSAQEAHEAIRPTDITRLSINGSSDEISLYNLIWKRTVASQMLPAIFASTQIEISSSQQHLFRLHGSILKEENWLKFYHGVLKNSDVSLPKLEHGQVLFLAPPKIKKEKKFTQPPGRYTDSSLILELEKKGIGRPSTYATTFSKLVARGYANKKNESYIVSSLGLQITEILKKYFKFMDFLYTAQMEEKLDLIAEKKMNFSIMMREFFSHFSSELKEAYLSFAVLSDEFCSRCQAPLLLKHAKYGYFLGCLNYPTCKELVPVYLLDGKIVRRSGELLAPEKCYKCQSAMYYRDGQYGPYYSCSSWPKCTGSRRIIYPESCPVCTEKQMVTAKNSDNKIILRCIKYPECKGSEEVPEKYHISYIDPQELDLKSLSEVKTIWKKGIKNEKIS